MAIDHQNEQVISIADAAQRLPGRPSVRTVWRWLDRGCRKTQLESILIGGRRYTSVEAVDRFLTAINEPDVKRASPATTAKRQRAIDQAERELQEAGL